MSRKTKIFLITAVISTIIFVLIATAALGVFWFNNYYYGTEDDLYDNTMQKSYVNTLLCGVDKDGVRTDVLILAQLNLITNKINMLQISRDTYVEINQLDGKINSAYAHSGKEEELFKEVEYILPGIEVDRYLLVNIQSFRDIVDAIGGVKFDVPADFKYDDPIQDLHIDLKKGMQTLDGEHAEQLVRFRKDNKERDIQFLYGISREEMQKDFIYAAIDQILSIKNVVKVPKLISIATDNLTTNFSVEDFEKYGPMVLRINTDDINIMSMPGDGYIGSRGIWYFYHDAAETQKIINEYFTPEREEISTQEIAIRNQLIGDDTVNYDIPSDLNLKKSFANRFLTVDILDGSGGEADIDKIISDIEAYGFKVKKTNKTSSVTYDKSFIIAKKDNDDGAKIAKAIGQDKYMINTDKRTGTAVTVIVGKDMK